MEKGTEILLSVEDLNKQFQTGNKIVHAVNGVTFQVRRGETFGLVGESGCGKTTTGRMIAGLTTPTSGKILFQGEDRTRITRRTRKQAGKNIQMVFQDPFACLDPRMTIGRILEEPMIIQGIGNAASRRKKAEEYLELVGLQKSYFDRFPHEFSGGQRQRIGIGRALILNPEMVVCDEPVSALDVSVQSQILNLLKSLQESMHLTYIFIAHGLNVVKHISDRIGVMYLGQLVEVLPSEDLLANMAHPYTQALLSAVPTPDPQVKKERIILKGDIPSPIDLPSGCCFHTRCPYAKDVCAKQAPEMQWNGERMVRCHFPLTTK